jgi:dihydroorotate dehydrogenase (fumarate)
MVDLSTTYLGLTLKNPLVASASPLSKKVSTVRELEDAGVAAVVMYSLFEEQITHESKELNYYLERGTESFAEAITYFPDLGHYNVGPEEYLNRIRKIKEAVDIPVIASLNGSTTGGWIDYAKRMQQAGADALELNLYYVHTDPRLTAQQIEQDAADLVADIRKQVRIPLSIKLSPYFTSLPNFAQKLVKSGANGLVLFNRFYQPDLDIETLEVVPNLHLSTSDELRLPLRWTAILYGQLKADLALTTGVHAPTDIVKAVMAGANVAMSASALLRNGIPYASELLRGLEQWMTDFEYQSVEQMRGSMSQQNVADPAAYERANYMKVLNSLDYKAI